MEKNRKIEKYLNDNDLDIINNEKCVKPTRENPFMNPSLIGNNNKYDSCSIENEHIKDNIDYFFNKNVFRETDDIYDKSLLDRQFYTVPSTSIPNNREKLASWQMKHRSIYGLRLIILYNTIFGRHILISPAF